MNNKNDSNKAQKDSIVGLIITIIVFYGAFLIGLILIFTHLDKLDFRDGINICFYISNIMLPFIIYFVPRVFRDKNN